MEGESCKMKIVLGSKTERKIKVVEKVLQVFFREYQLLSYKALSGVSETPWDKETYDGSINRAEDSKKNVSGVDFSIGLESGLVERYGMIFEEAWCCIILKDGKKYFGYSSGLKLPDYVTTRMKKENLAHWQLMQLMEDEFHLDDSDTWGNYSGNLISRDVSLEEALRNALIQIKEHDKSFYHR